MAIKQPQKGTSGGPADEETETSSDAEVEETPVAETDGEDASAESDLGDLDALAAREGEPVEEGDDGPAAAQLGTGRYVLAAFFTAGILAAYILGQALHSVWATLSNKDWFSTALPLLASIPDEEKATYSTLLGAVIALVVVFRTYKRADVREWTDEVAAELTKVKWPTRKEVGSSTVIVIAVSVVATTYLALLDRFWGFVTNLVYGTGS